MTVESTLAAMLGGRGKYLATVENAVHGVDLEVERDAGNQVRIMTGNPEHSLDFWRRLRVICDQSIRQLEGKE